MNVELVRCGLMDAEAQAQAMRGCAAVFHCAYDWRTEGDGGRHVNVDGTLNLYRAASEAGCRRFIHLSTASVHGYDAAGEIDEDYPLSTSKRPYIANKVAIENALRRAAGERGAAGQGGAAGERGAASLAILRPAIVFGPGYNAWTTQIVDGLRSGSQALVNGGSGTCNVTYVDNLVDAMLLCSEREEAVGRTFFVTDGTPMSWREYVGALAGLCGVDMGAVPEFSLEEIVAADSQRNRPPTLRSVLGDPSVRGRFDQVPWISAAYRFLRPVARRLRRFGARSGAGPAAPGEPTRRPPAGVRLGHALVRAGTATYSIERIRAALGFRPRVGFEEAMRRTAAWLRFARRID
jgi:nucleoside-diphosphate-sugar epimerase